MVIFGTRLICRDAQECTANGWKQPKISFLFIMVAIRLNRQGSKDRPFYKIVVVDSRARRDGAFIEQLGTYNPMAEGENFTLDLEKTDKWLANGA